MKSGKKKKKKKKKKMLFWIKNKQKPLKFKRIVEPNRVKRVFDLHYLKISFNSLKKVFHHVKYRVFFSGR